MEGVGQVLGGVKQPFNSSRHVSPLTYPTTQPAPAEPVGTYFDPRPPADHNKKELKGSNSSLTQAESHIPRSYKQEATLLKDLNGAQNFLIQSRQEIIIITSQ